MKYSKKAFSVVAFAAILTGTTLAAQDVEPTGLDQISEILASDVLINNKVPTEEIAKAQQSALAMNALIKEAIKARGLANDGSISIADTREINNYLVQYHSNEWYNLRGQDDGADSTGYYLVDRRFLRTRTTIMNRSAGLIWGEIYDIGFHTTPAPCATVAKTLTNYKGTRTAGFSDVAYRLNEIMQNDIASGTLYNNGIKEVKGTTNSSLDTFVEIIMNDEGLSNDIPTSSIREGAQSANAMNHLIVEAIVAQGLANDKKLTPADARQINDYLVANYKYRWIELYGQDASQGAESGFKLVEQNGAYSRMFGNDAVNTVAEWIYRLGLEVDDASSSSTNPNFEKTAYWLETLLKTDLEAGRLNNPDYQEVTGLNDIVEIIMNDEGLSSNIPTSSIDEGAQSADAMNQLIIEAIIEEGLANDGKLTPADARQINNYLVANYKYRWIELYGNDASQGAETGFQLVESNGALSRMYGNNAVNTVADNIYRLGIELDNDCPTLNTNPDFEKIAYWLETLLETELKTGRLNNPDYHEVTGTTGTPFDNIIPFIYNNLTLQRSVSMGKIRTAARSANRMNELIVEAINTTGVADDDHISVSDVKQISAYLVSNHAAEWAELHGHRIVETGEVTGYHSIQNNGAICEAYAANAVNAIGNMYHLGFASPYPIFMVSEEGGKSGTFSGMAYYLNTLLKNDFDLSKRFW